jgi:hypothetical protein
MMSFLKLPILNAIPALLVAAAGVALAWVAFRQSIWLAALLAALPIVIGLATFWWGNRLLTKRKPVDAVKFLEWGVLVPGTVVAVTSGLLIGAGVFLEPSKTASVETQKLLAASLAAFGGFLTASFIKSAEDADAEWTGALVREAFLDGYGDSIPNGTDAWKALHSGSWRGLSGWGKADRRRRAEIIGDPAASKPHASSHSDRSTLGPTGGSLLD